MMSGWASTAPELDTQGGTTDREELNAIKKQLSDLQAKLSKL